MAMKKAAKKSAKKAAKKPVKKAAVKKAVKKAPAKKAAKKATAKTSSTPRVHTTHYRAVSRHSTHPAPWTRFWRLLSKLTLVSFPLMTAGSTTIRTV